MRYFGFLLLISYLQAAPALALNRAAEKRALEVVTRAEAELMSLSVEGSRAEWVKSTYVTDDTEGLAARASERSLEASGRWAAEARKFKESDLSPVTARKIHLLKINAGPALSNAAERAEFTKLSAELEGMYAKGKICTFPNTQSAAILKTYDQDNDRCLNLEEISRVLSESKSEFEQKFVWEKWHEISVPMREKYARLVVLSNKGSKEAGFKDTGVMWRSRYDMAPDQFSQELDRLWNQMRPLYESLHAYVRWNLRKVYGAQAVPERGPIPAHLLGNMWAQEWGSLFPRFQLGSADPGYDLTAILRNRKTTSKQLVKYGENFFISLGMPALPQTFWQRSQFDRPRDREVVCHASAWNIDLEEDVRIKMCIDVSEEEFTTVHHELGHNYYQLACRKQSFLFRDSANDGFHEALGDLIALSVTPEYLNKLGFLPQVPDASKDIGLLLQKALEKISFLPFGLLIDQWRWKVFSGEITPEQMNQAWWDLRLKYQGIAPSGQRGESFFDPGAKYHVSASVPYTRYFLASVLQFQMHRALSQQAGCASPLHRCSIYGSKAAGQKITSMMELGLSQPWMNALEQVTGQRQMDATAILDYFQPLQKWLDEQNRGHAVGW